MFQAQGFQAEASFCHYYWEKGAQPNVCIINQHYPSIRPYYSPISGWGVDPSYPGSQRPLKIVTGIVDEINPY